MNDLVEEWINKAEGDRQTARREVSVIVSPNWDAVCFHAQQAVEKYLKGLLQQERIPFTPTHDLTQL
jgi:HEPN domain-containing protein